MKLKKLALLMAPALVLSANSYSATNSISTEIKEGSAKTLEERVFAISASIKKEKINPKNTDKGYLDESLDLSGAEATISRIFNIGEGFALSVGIEGSLTNGEASKLASEYKDFNVKKIEYGISQKISYHLPYKKGRIAPFIGVGAYKGKMDYKASAANLSELDIEIKTKYTKLSASTGVEYSFDNGVTPFIKYSVSKMSFDKDLEFAVNLDGKELHSNTVSGGKELNSTTKDIMFGVGYLF